MTDINRERGREKKHEVKEREREIEREEQVMEIQYGYQNFHARFI